MKPGFILVFNTTELVQSFLNTWGITPGDQFPQRSWGSSGISSAHCDYRPPPAQAQAQPAQAQAQAQEELPPPPLQPPLEEDEEEGGGIGLVLFVIRLVKSVILPTTLLEKLDIPSTMEAAKSPPGSTGKLGPLDLPGLACFKLGPDDRVGVAVDV